MLENALTTARKLAPGILLAALIAGISILVSGKESGLALPCALVLGIAAQYIIKAGAEGVAFTSRTILRMGVALLGFRISFEQITALGLPSALLVVGGVLCTILFGLWAARRLGLGGDFGILTGGATAICGASAALAIASILPKEKISDRDTTFTVIAVTTLSTLCMVLYPALIALTDMDDHTAGFLIGATVHDVAQVVGAGYMISPEAGDTATIVKLFRVALLVPVTMGLVLIYAKSATDGRGKIPSIPWFLILFIAFVALRSLGLVPQAAIDAATETSRWALCMAVAAVGLKTSLSDFRKTGPKAILLAIAETIFLLIFVLAGVYLL